jgi:starch synthase
MPTHDAIYHTVIWAVELYWTDRDTYKKLQKNAMKMHFGWDDAASSYEEVYRYAISKRHVSKLQ